MDLRAFVRQALDDIEGALADHLRERGEIATDEHDTRFGDVVFDVAVTTSETSTSEGKAGIQVLGTGIGGNLASGVQREEISRIHITVRGMHNLEFRRR